MIWFVSLVCLVNLGETSLASLAEIFRTRWCLGENAHCPINIYKNFDLCCKPYVCTVVPRTCKPNILIQFSEYKDYRCMLPVISISTTELISQNPIEANLGNDKSLATENLNGTKWSKVSNTTIIPINPEEYTTNHSYQTFQTDKKNDDHGGSREYTTETQPNQSLLKLLDDSNSETVNSNEIKCLVKRFTSNDSSSYTEDNSSESSISTSSQSQGDNSNETTEAKSNFSDNNSFLSEQDQNNTSIVYSDSSDAEYYSHDYGNNKTITGKTNITEQQFNYLRNKTNEEYFSANKSVSVESEEDWHSSEMKLDSRPVLQKIITIRPFSFFSHAEVVKLKLSSEISE